MNAPHSPARRLGLSLGLLVLSAACRSVPTATAIPRDRDRIHPVGARDVPVTLEVVDSRPAPIGREVTVAFTNRGQQAFAYSGHGPGRPLFELRVWRDGKWRTRVYGWCGSGRDLHVLPPGASRTMTVALPTAETWIVGLRVRTEDGVTRTVWSAELGPELVARANG